MDASLEMVTVDQLLSRVGEMRRLNWRLVQIGATRLPDQVELTYSFDREGRLSSLRVQVPAEGAKIPSITPSYWCAFLYENEIHDLFNVQVENLNVDFHGHLYQTAIKFPFGRTKAPAAKAPVTPATSAAPNPAEPALSPALRPSPLVS